MRNHKSSTMTQVENDYHRTAKTSFASPGCGIQPPPANVIKSFLNHGICVSHVNSIIWHIRFWGSGWLARHARTDLKVSSQENRGVLSQSWLVLCGLVTMTTSTKMILGLVEDNDSIQVDIGSVTNIQMLPQDITTMARKTPNHPRISSVLVYNHH